MEVPNVLNNHELGLPARRGSVNGPSCGGALLRQTNRCCPTRVIRTLSRENGVDIEISRLPVCLTISAVAVSRDVSGATSSLCWSLRKTIIGPE